jgi:TRAP-type C4-dicarboxylate transport system permease small subunit
MIESVLRGVRGLISFLRVVTGVLLVLSIALNFANVIGRYFFNASIFWAEEIMLYLMVGCVFLGNGVVAWSGRQIRMDVIVAMMPEKVRHALHLLSELVLIATALAIIVFSFPVVRDLFNFDQRSQSAELQLFIPQSMVPIGFAIMVLMVVVRLLTTDRHAAGPTGH